MANCTNFDSSLVLPSTLTAISSDFLRGCSNFTQPLALPGGLTDIGVYFMYNASKFVGPLDVSTGSAPIAMSPSLPYTLSTMSASDPMYATGITLTGANAQTWKDAFPNRTDVPYRNLIVANS